METNTVKKAQVINLMLLANLKFLPANSAKGFSFLAQINRPIIPSHVTKLAHSVMVNGGIARPVIVAKLPFLNSNDYYIIDGQHLYHVALRLNLPIPYTVIEIKDEEDLVERIALYNASSKTWALFDYVTAWSVIRPDFVKLKKYYETYDFELTLLTDILSGGYRTDGKTLKNGTFEIENEVKAKAVLDHLTDVLKVVTRMSRVENRMFNYEYIKFLRTVGTAYNHDRFLKKLEQNKKQFVLATQDKEVLQKLFKTLL